MTTQEKIEKLELAARGCAPTASAILREVIEALKTEDANVQFARGQERNRTARLSTVIER